MEHLMKLRTPLRGGFTRIANKLNDCLVTEQKDIDEMEILLAQLDEKWRELDLKEKEIHALLLADTECTPEDFDKEYESFETYSEKYIRLKTKATKIINKVDIENIGVQNETTSKRKFKLPRIELKKFNGDIKEWLGFWGQFKKIHEDSEIDPEDKLQYLCQSTVEGSRARQIVDSFPPTAENYEQVIECFKTRFGRDDLLIEVYVRELLSLILSNSMNQNKSRNLTNLYDKIETHLRALETLGVTSDKYASMLYPLVESCLPEDIIRVWERSMSLTKESDKSFNKLTALMTFLKAEVEGEERISIAKEGFGLEMKRKGKHCHPTEVVHDKPFMTAAGLIAVTENHKPPVCLFCEGAHESAMCRKAMRMNVDDRKRILAEKGSCFLCLKIGHRVRNCRSRLKCNKCSGRHSTIICYGNKFKEDNKTKTTESSVNPSITNDTALSNRTCTEEILLQTLYVRLRGKSKTKIVRALIDTGSQRSYLSKHVAEEMNYNFIKEENVVHNLFGNRAHSEKHSRYRVYVSSIEGDYHCNFEVLDQHKICSDVPIPKLQTCSKELFDHNIVVTDELISKEEKTLEIDLLIGADVGGKLFSDKIIHLPCGLIAVKTHLGWTVMGKIPRQASDTNNMMVVTNLFSNDISITELWDLDSIGIKDPVTRKIKEESDLKTKLRFQNSVLINDEGRYEVFLPWAEDHVPLPTNKNLALKRLDSTTSRLHSQNLFNRYDEVFNNWRDLGIIEELKQCEAVDYGHFLPHRPVLKEHSSTPVRPVFDASARAKASPSLNQCLECGPNLIELIPSILLRFREGRFATIADIEKAFLQISIRPEDRDYLRFFWWNRDDEKQLKIFRHTRVVFGVKSSPFLLAAVIEYHLQRKIAKSHDDKQVLDKLTSSFYVDNLVTSFEDVSEMKQFIEESRRILLEGKFNLRGWLCTGDILPTETFIPVLGLLWDSHKDNLTINLNWLETFELGEITKRLVLTVAHKVFDPIGILSPVLLFPKTMLQAFWKSGISWDAPVEEDTKQKFIKWYNDLVLLREISIPRWISIDRDNKNLCSIHTFCDASSNAYAAAVFLRVQTSSSTEVHLLASKSRIAPIKPITIPRLELIAATVGARLCISVLKGLHWENVKLYFWTDSTTVLTWIQKEENWTVFVANRVKEIRNLTDPNSWRHISGAENPADLPSRGCSVKKFLALKWWKGPLWLKKDENEWPTSSAICNYEDIAQEMKKSKVLQSHVNMETEQMFQRISSYVRLVRVLGWIYRFYFNMKSKVRSTGDLTVKELNYAEWVILKEIQQEAFPDGINDQGIRSLHPVLDENGLLRAKTQVFRRRDKKNFRMPIILPSKHRIVHMLVMSKHKELSHSGVQILMNHLRENYWILQSRKTIRRVISSCIRCKRFTVTHPEPKTTPLPEDRVRKAAIFEVTGVDLAGPLYLKGGIKSWIVLFTCSVYRAVHLELITSLTAEAFLQSLRRFISRRGRPSIIYSDHGSNFVKANNELSKLDWQKIETQCSLQKINWKFIPPSAPWWGGWWERLVGMVKRNLRRVLGQACLTYEELITVLCDIESQINSRPLTYLSEDINDLVALSPAMFLQELRESGVPDIDKIDAKYMRKRYLYLQKVREDLRKRFRVEYLGQLRHANKGFDSKNISVGELVLVGSDNLKRVQWPIGRITEVLPGTDRVVRVVRIKTKTGIITRPVQRVYPLELTDKTDISSLRNAVPKNKLSEQTADPSISEAQDEPSAKPAVVTRYGRTVKPVQRLNLNPARQSKLSSYITNELKVGGVSLPSKQ